MKKTFLSIAIVIASLMGASTLSAQTAAPTPTEQQGQRTDRGKAKGMNPFEGLNLTEKQQSELKALAESRRAEMSKQKDQKKQDMKAMKEKRQNARKEYLAKIKGILTPEQYVQFLENSWLKSGNQGRANMGSKGQKAGKDGKTPGNNGKKGQRDGKKGQRPDRQPQGQRQSN